MLSVLTDVLPQPIVVARRLFKVLWSQYSNLASKGKRHPAAYLTVLFERFGTHGLNLNVVAENHVLNPKPKDLKPKYPCCHCCNDFAPITWPSSSP